MPAPTFPNIAPGQGSSRKVKYRTLTADFGDGYSQPVPDGINTRVEEWDLSFNEYPEAEVMQIVNFLDGLGGVEFFYWTPPGEATPKKWRQDGEYSLSYKGHAAMTLKLKIKLVYNLDS